MPSLEEIYPTLHAILSPEQWASISLAWRGPRDASSSPDGAHSANCPDSKVIASNLQDPSLLLDSNILDSDQTRLDSDRTPPPWWSDVARYDWARHRAADAQTSIPDNPTEIMLNPTLSLLTSTWKLSEVVDRSDAAQVTDLSRRLEHHLIWRGPRSGKIYARQATQDDLLALKLVLEGTDPAAAATEAKVPVGRIDRTLFEAIDAGLLIPPRSRIRRPSSANLPTEGIAERYLATSVFTLQWHITHACELSCKHCYDRSRRRAVSVEEAERVLDDLRSFCASKRVRGHVSFSGGNPFLHPHFETIYALAVDRGFGTSILANPVPRSELERILNIQRPRFFQVSLEGLETHNDSIRGSGSFARVLSFLADLKDLQIQSNVMLTLTGANIEEVLRLGEHLRERADAFTFNRLSQVGEGANLTLPDENRFHSFLHEYLNAASTNPVLALKENLLNAARMERREDPFGGCTGFGCGAAFNFLCLLPDGEVHACRKFPSFLGYIGDGSLEAIYDSPLSERYRRGCLHEDCRACGLRAVCGGCMAVVHGTGKDPFTTKDPHCFLDRAHPSMTSVRRA